MAFLFFIPLLETSSWVKEGFLVQNREEMRPRSECLCIHMSRVTPSNLHRHQTHPVTEEPEITSLSVSSTTFSWSTVSL